MVSNTWRLKARSLCRATATMLNLFEQLDMVKVKQKKLKDGEKGGARNRRK